jgi:hypothetical protein
MITSSCVLNLTIPGHAFLHIMAKVLASELDKGVMDKTRRS